MLLNMTLNTCFVLPQSDYRAMMESDIPGVMRAQRVQNLPKMRVNLKTVAVKRHKKMLMV